jgi:signal transduction histidine kinase
MRFSSDRGSIEALLRTSRALAAELDFDRLVQILTDEARTLCRAQFGAFFYNVMREGRDGYDLYTVSGVDRAAFSKFPLPRNTEIFAPTFGGERVVRHDDITRHPRFGKNPPYYGMPEGHLPVRSYLAVPVIARAGGVLGGLFFGHSEIGVFNEEDERLLVAVAAQASVAIENARLYRDVKEARDTEAHRAALMKAIGEVLSRDDAFDVRLQRCMQAIVDHAGAAFARIWEYDGPENLLVLRGSAGMYTHLDGAHSCIPVGQCIVGAIAASRQRHITNDVQADPGIADKEWVRREGMLAFAGFPLMLKGQLLGVLAIFAKHPLSAATVQTLADIAGQMAAMLERNHLEKVRERFRKLFLGMLGHDLRNPLNAISISAQLLERADGMPERSHAAVGRITRSAERMARMVEQLLELARTRSFNAEGLPVVRRPANLHAIAHETVEELRTAHPEREIDESYEGDGKGHWDVDRMAQVFSNLIGNALSYGDPQTPVRLRLWRHGEAISGEVHNRGEPIADDTIQGLFDPLRRASNARTAKTEGLGLGLYITNEIVLAHGGTMFVASSAESGTVFRFTLPAEAP